MIHPGRIQLLNDREIQPGDFVLYWMQQSQRALGNHALEYAVAEANRMNKGIVVVFGLTDRYPEANLRHYRFMVEGLRETRQTLANRGIKMAICLGSPEAVALSAARKAVMTVCDRGYLRHQKQWRRQVARHARCRVVQVEGDVIVPVEETSDKAEYAARFIRPKLHRLMDRYLDALPEPPVRRSSLDIRVTGEVTPDVGNLLARLKVDRRVPPVSDRFKGGTTEAARILARFLKSNARHYKANRNQPQTDDVSYMGMYLHFGQISPLVVARHIRAAKQIASENREAFLEELVVRRELAINYVHYNDRYDSFEGLPSWAKATLGEHAGDRREFVYHRAQLEEAQTHDPYWNAAAKEMVHTGYMHNYMRMYWVKKILEWSPTPRDGHETALYLNNKYFIDGRDPNSYAGVSWGFGLHDRPWKERPVFGKVRYMNAAGLERKCDIRAYVKKVDRLIATGVSGPA